MNKRQEYKLDPTPIGLGGQADVYFGVRLTDGFPIALKQRKRDDSEARARMKREIEALQRLSHDNIMPIIDSDDRDHEWYVMPRGLRSLREVPTPIDDQTLRAAVEAVLTALSAAHAADMPHRDVKPENVIEIAVDGQARWVLADWRRYT